MMMTTITSFAQPLLLAATTLTLYASGMRSKEAPSEEDSSLIKKICKVAFGIFKAAISLFHYWINPAFATVAFFGTIIWAKEVDERAAKISQAWHDQPWTFSCLTLATAAFSMPVALVTGTVFWACSMGLNLAPKRELSTQIVQ